MPVDRGPMDPSDPPSPSGGWSTEIVTVKNAIVCPPAVSAMVQPCGVLTGDGSYCRHSATWRGGRAMMTMPRAPSTEVDKLAGRHLFAGQLWAHFGHFIAESMSRLWALDQLDEMPESIVFIPKRPKMQKKMIGYQREFFELLGIKIPIRVIDKPTEVENLIIPGQGFGLGAISAGTQPFRNYFAGNFAPGIKPKGDKLLYLSRSRLGGREGGAVLEGRLEQNLASKGYAICHPQTLSIRDQVAKYRAAEKVVGLDGSAFHLFAFVGNPSQNVAIILRRNSNVFHALRSHIQSFSGITPTIINAVAADWVPENQSRPGRYSFGQLNFEALGELLTASGFISETRDWDVPRFREMRRAMERFSQEKGCEFIRVRNTGKVDAVDVA